MMCRVSWGVFNAFQMPKNNVLSHSWIISSVVTMKLSATFSALVALVPLVATQQTVSYKVPQSFYVSLKSAHFFQIYGQCALH